MRLLLDTATVIRIATDEAKLSETARAAYRAESNAPFISVVSIWEILVENRDPASKLAPEIVRNARGVR